MHFLFWIVTIFEEYLSAHWSFHQWTRTSVCVEESFIFSDFLEPVNIEMAVEEVQYGWHRITCILGNVSVFCQHGFLGDQVHVTFM